MTRLLLAFLTMTGCALMCVPSAHAVTAAQLDAYVTSTAKAWQTQVTAAGQITDPLDGHRSEQFGTLKLADSMLQAARRTGDESLEQAAASVLARAASTPSPNDPFNLAGLGGTLRAGRDGAFGAQAWQQLSGPLTSWAAGAPPYTDTNHCLGRAGCYNNWHLVWSAAVAQLLDAGVTGAPGSITADVDAATARVRQIVCELAPAHAGPVVRTPAGGQAHVLSDPGSQPPAYHLYSTYWLGVITETQPQIASCPAAQQMKARAQRYAMAMMAPDGDLAWTGRSTQQAWVLAAAAAIGARQAAADPRNAAVWMSYADRAVSRLMARHPRRNGIFPVVPGLAVRADRSIMDGYARQTEYSGLTLWLLTDALAHWPAGTERHAIPADRDSMFADPAGSGQVNRRAGNVWFSVMTKSTAADPRSGQGLTAVKVRDHGRWRDLIAVRPRERRNRNISRWTLRRAGHAFGVTLRAARSVPGGVTFTGRVPASVTAAGRGVQVTVTVPARSRLEHTYWLTAHARVRAPGQQTRRGRCTVTASGKACPITVTTVNPAGRPARRSVRVTLR